MQRLNLVNQNMSKRLKFSQNENILERLKINKDTKLKYICPKDKEELKNIIEHELKTNPNNVGDGIVDLNFIDTSQITDMSILFNDLYNNYNRIVNIDISKWDVSNVSGMRWMFSECKYLETTGDLENWDVSNVENMHGMFYGCTSLKNKPSWYKE